MPYIGNTPAEKYAAFNVQYFTTSATTSYTLDRAVANELDIRLVINNVIQEPGAGKAYTAAGTTLTLSAATAGSDTMYAVYIGKAVQTVNPGAGSVGTTALADNAVTLGKMASGTDGNIISYDASGNPVAVATGSSGQVLTSAGAGAPPTFAAASGTTINNNADNRVITGSGTANTLEGEANLTYDGSNLNVTGQINPTADIDLDNNQAYRSAGEALLARYSPIIELGSGQAGDYLKLKAGGAERVRIHTNGVMSAANGIALGVGTASTASNVLDDYENGSWNPTWVLGTSGSMSTANASGYWYKLGGFVTIYGYIAFNVASSPTGTIYIGSLPFTPNAGYGQSSNFHGQGWCSGAWGWGNGASAGYHPTGINVRTNGLEIVSTGVSPNSDAYGGRSYTLDGQTQTMYTSSNYGQIYFGAIYKT